MTSFFFFPSPQQLITEAELDSFNLPIYSTSSEEMVKLVDKNGHFSIKTVELTNPTSWLEGPIDIKAWTMHVRAAMEAMFTKHFRIEIIGEMFNRLIRRLFEFSDKVESGYKEKTQLFVVLMRK